MKQICVLAGDYKQYQEWLRKNKLTPKEAIFGNSRENFDGVESLRSRLSGRSLSAGIHEIYMNLL
jgi:hypothetical protein